MRDIKSRWKKDWEYLNPVLRKGEMGHEKNSGRIKIGDGRTAWSSLPFVMIETPERLSESALREAYASSQVDLPAAFAGMGFGAYTVYRTVGGYAVAIALDALRPAAGVTYYVSPTGVTGNSGLTEASPTTLPTALAKVDVGTIICLPGEYFRNSHTAPVVQKSVNIIGRDGAILTGFETPSALTWTVQAGNVYQATRANTNAVVDKRAAYLSAAGDYPLYEKKADLASITGPGQWAIVGTTVYVWALGNANLATDSSFLRLSLNAGSTVLSVTGNNILYVENVQLEGGGTATAGVLTAASAGGTGGVPKLIAVDTVVKYSPTNGVVVTGALWVILVRFGVAMTMNDGYNYHSGTFNGTTYVPDVIEVDCWSRATGQHTTVESQNGSTAHDGVRVIRVSGDYRDSLGPAVAEDSGGKSWNAECIAGDSRATARPWAYAATATGSEMWLEDSAALPGQTALYADGTSKIHTRRVRTGALLAASSATSGSGTIDAY